MESIVEIKSSKELDILKECGQIASSVLVILKGLLCDGVSTIDIDYCARREIKKLGAVPAFLGYRGYPASVCVSINDELVHGVPSKQKRIRNGDIVSIDIGIKYNGFYGDVAATYGVGVISAVAQKLIEVGSSVFDLVLVNSIPAKRIGDLSSSIKKYIENHGFSVVRDYVGHAIGRRLHEEPAVPNFGVPESGVRLTEGMVLAVEPMLCEGDYALKTDDDGWTVRTRDGKLCAHFEHMILVASPPVVLTYWDEKGRKNNS